MRSEQPAEGTGREAGVASDRSSDRFSEKKGCIAAEGRWSEVSRAELAGQTRPVGKSWCPKPVAGLEACILDTSGRGTDLDMMIVSIPEQSSLVFADAMVMLVHAGPLPAHRPIRAAEYLL